MSSTTDDVCEENSPRAIQNEYIVEHLFSFLSVNDIKNCRLANLMWMKVGTKPLRKRTHIFFDFSGGKHLGNYLDPREKERIFLETNNRMKEVRDYCGEKAPESTPISSFAYCGKFKYFDLIKYLDDVRSYTIELKLLYAIYCDDEKLEGSKKMTVDISPQISPHLTKLHLELFFATNCTFSLCLHQISFVKEIHLDGCTIVSDGNGKRLSPSHITLGSGNKYIKNGAEVKTFLVNENFDLTLTKQINLEGENLILDFSDCANDQIKRTVTLADITVRNWEMCNWKIKTFYLEGIPFLDKNFIEMEELTVINLTIDLSKIYNPKSLLKLYCYPNTKINNSPFFLPNLVDVTLKCENCVAKLPYFTNNKNISKMWLEGHYLNHAMSVNVNDFPKGINELRLTTSIGVHGEGTCELQTLYMEGYLFTNSYSTFGSKFRPVTFKIYCSVISTDEEIQDVVQLLNLGDSYGRLVIGKFVWGGK